MMSVISATKERRPIGRLSFVRYVLKLLHLMALGTIAGRYEGIIAVVAGAA